MACLGQQGGQRLPAVARTCFSSIPSPFTHGRGGRNGADSAEKRRWLELQPTFNVVLHTFVHATLLGSRNSRY